MKPPPYVPISALCAIIIPKISEKVNRDCKKRTGFADFAGILILDLKNGGDFGIIKINKRRWLGISLLLRVEMARKRSGSGVKPIFVAWARRRDNPKELS